MAKYIYFTYVKYGSPGGKHRGGISWGARCIAPGATFWGNGSQPLFGTPKASIQPLFRMPKASETLFGETV